MNDYELDMMLDNSNPQPRRRRTGPRTYRRNARKRNRKIVFLMAVVLASTFAAGAAVGFTANDTPAEVRVVHATPIQTVAPIIDMDDDNEDKLIEAALLAQGYFRDDIPLSYELQDYLHTACEEAGIPEYYELALAVIQKESTFRNIIGDDGASMGYMQVQTRWHEDRMERLGVTDLMHPYSNFRVGCDFLAELIGKYDNLTDALTYYNSGDTGPSKYAEDVLNFYADLSI